MDVRQKKLIEEVKVDWLLQFRNKFQDYLLNYYGNKKKRWRGRSFTYRTDRKLDRSFILNLKNSIKKSGIKEPLVLTLDRNGNPILKYGGSRTVVSKFLGYEYIPVIMEIDGCFLKPSDYFGVEWKSKMCRSINES